MYKYEQLTPHTNDKAEAHASLCGVAQYGTMAYVWT